MDQTRYLKITNNICHALILSRDHILNQNENLNSKQQITIQILNEEIQKVESVLQKYLDI